MKKVSVILLCLMSLCTLHTVHVMGEPTTMEQHPVQIMSEYSANIKPNTNDIFTIEYKYINGTQTAAMQLDASTVCNHAGTINMPSGEYKIVSIQYQGTSQAIKDEGYAVSSKFSTKNATGYIYLKIGQDKVQSFVNTYEDVLTVAGTAPQTTVADGNATGTVPNESGMTTSAESISPSMAVPDTSGGTDTSAESVSTGTESVQQVEAESPAIEHYDEDSNHSNQPTWRSAIIKIAIVSVIFLIGMAVLFIFHKKGKI